MKERRYKDVKTQIHNARCKFLENNDWIRIIIYYYFCLFICIPAFAAFFYKLFFNYCYLIIFFNFFFYFSLFGSVIPLILIPISDSFYLILFLRFIQGFAIAGLPSTALAYISEEIDYKHAKIAVGFYISSNAVGGMLGRVISGYLTDI